MEKLLDLYISGDFVEEVLIERKHQLETTITNLQREQEQVTALLGSVNYTDQDIAVIEEFCSKIRNNLDNVTFEGKRRVLDLLDVHGTLIEENGERVLYFTCTVYPQPQSLVLTSPSSSTCNRQHFFIITAKLSIGGKYVFQPISMELLDKADLPKLRFRSPLTRKWDYSRL